MPLLKLHTSMRVPEPGREALLKALSEITAATIGKPEQYMMVTLSDGAMVMGGDGGPAAFADLRSIGGLDGLVNKQLSKKIAALLDEQLGIPAARVYLNFTNLAGSDWGWNGGTFG
jgi:phenylpyruvate tautomerase